MLWPTPKGHVVTVTNPGIYGNVILLKKVKSCAQRLEEFFFQPETYELMTLPVTRLFPALAVDILLGCHTIVSYPSIVLISDIFAAS